MRDLASEYGLLPRPRDVRPLGGEFTVPPGAGIEVTGFGAEEVSRLECAGLRMGLRPASWRSVDPPVRVDHDDALHDEQFELLIQQNGVRIRSGGAAGAFYALSLLRQFLPADLLRSEHPELGGSILPACIVRDEPALSWRGLLLDPARHFIPVHEILRFIEQCAAHRINRLQLHLTDDQGWRIESRAYPELHRIGSVRAQSQTSHSNDPLRYDGTPHGGYYSPADIEQLVAYAADRYVTVVPEIEVPGHTGALLAAYPQHGVPVLPEREVTTSWGVMQSLLSPLPATRNFVAGVLEEVMTQFPGEYLHLGGDESLLAAWEDDPQVQAFARSHGLSDTHAVFAHFMGELATQLRRNGKTLISWDDSYAFDPRSAPEGVVMAWRGSEVARRAAADGHDVVLCPVMPTYFDYYQSADPDEPLAIGGPITLADVAAFQPVPPDWSAAESSRLLGVQAQLWGEYIPDSRQLEYMAFPRLCAFAEVAWQGRSAVFDDLVQRLELHLARLRAADINYRPLEGPRPWQRGGTGNRRNRPDRSVNATLALLADAAASGTVADSEAFRSLHKSD